MDALAGIRVLDLTQIMAGPFCTELLADLGAEVIKIERPNGGDDARRMGSNIAPNESLSFIAMNRNKLGMAIDIRTEAGRNLLLRLIQTADVLVENFRPGTMAHLGLSYEQVQAINPGLVYCSISAFGQTGPFAERGGFDLVAQAMSGIISVTGTPDHPAKCGVPLSDLNAGLFASHAILAALLYRGKTGEGQYIDTSLLEGALAYTIWESNEYWSTGDNPKGLGTAHRNSSPYQTFPTADGAIAIGAANQRNWERLAEVLDADELLHDSRFETNRLRTVHRDELASILAPIFQQRSTSEWLEALDAAQVPAGPVLRMSEVYAHPQVIARHMEDTYQHPLAGLVHSIGMPVKLSRTPARIHCPAPLLGQHTFRIMKTLGMTDEECLELEREGIVVDAHWKEPEE
ncbi:MAG: CoA transferase [Sulfobacillus benefaciens]|uniref:CoA transferase n=1 Tax=Sulfobacillus benefaciens TaxID=453960 RepID=A0A2T2WUK9_9FIRM|nr:MAG: CoA transferase [Sulfobacillus benefaciens]